MGDIVVGVDPGQKTDPCGICVAEIQKRVDIPHYVVRLVERVELGTKYTALRDRLVDLDNKLTRRGDAEYRIESNAAGIPLLDILNETQLRGRLVAIFTKGGSKVTVRDGGKELSVGKAALITRVVTLLEQNRIHLPDTPMANELLDELSRFGRETTRGNVRYEAETGHDDLVMALAMTVWAHRQPKRRAGWGWGNEGGRRAEWHGREFTVHYTGR